MLRLREGDKITVCDMQKNVYDGTLTFVSADMAEAALSDCRPSPAEPPYTVTLYQGMPKGDKLDTIVQKAVELGVTRVVPVMCERAVSRPDEKSMEKKIHGGLGHSALHLTAAKVITVLISLISSSVSLGGRPVFARIVGLVVTPSSG